MFVEKILRNLYILITLYMLFSITDIKSIEFVPFWIIAFVITIYMALLMDEVYHILKNYE